ncbi:unnamed protein product [Urochloa decumbens]|uniref:Transcription initiation factor IIE subunit alpha N-terminal domain-containing protein n=1 Tax=Urochloa decumbens TaxID=240449 RepID=A0ABC9GXJ2_9POAL
MPKQSDEGRMEPTAASSVADADGGGAGACPWPLPTAVMDAIEPFARLVRLMGRGFYTDVVIRDREVRTDASDENRGLAVVVLDGLTRFAWINESELARLLKIKENTLILLVSEKIFDKVLMLYLSLQGKQVKTNDAISEKEDGSFNVLAGSYCCLDYSQVVDVTRYRLHCMKKYLKENLDYTAVMEEYICCICKRSYSALDVVHLISKSGMTFRCENCEGELIAQNGNASSRRESRANFANMLKRFKEQVKPIELQLSILKNMSALDFMTIEQWAHTNMVQFVADLSSNDIFETRVETPLPNSCARLDGAESVSDYTGVKVLPNWIVQKGMALTKAEKGEQQPSKDERRVGMKAKRGDGGYGGDSYNVVESGASLRRRT